MNTMIKTLSIIALSLFGLTVNAYDFMVNGIAYNINSDGNTVTVTYEVNSSGAHYIDEPEGQLTIPSSVSYNGKSYTVTSIGNSSFAWCRKITSVILPNTLIDVGAGAFSHCSSLKVISFGGQEKTIDGSAFTYTDVENIIIPNSVTTIGNYAFEGCKSLKKVVIGEGVTYIGFYAFRDCNHADELVVGKSLSGTGYAGALPGARNVTWKAMDFENKNGTSTLINGVEHLQINDGVKRLPNCFVSAVELDINIPESVQIIGNNAFSSIQKINETLIISASVSEIGSEAFKSCGGLTSLIVPNAEIGESAFMNTPHLLHVTLGPGVNKIGDRAFYSAVYVNGAYTYLNSLHNQNPEPQQINSNVFNRETYQNCTLYVPSGSVSKYKSAQGWQLFRNIVGEDSGIEDIVSDKLNCVEIERYAVDGCLLSTPQSGINIVRYSDGSVRKVLVPNN